MILILRWIWFFAFLAIFSAVVGMLLNTLFGWQQPWWAVGAAGLAGLIGGNALQYAEDRGWIRGVFWDRSKFEARERELAEDRERILAEAKRQLHRE